MVGPRLTKSGQIDHRFRGQRRERVGDFRHYEQAPRNETCCGPAFFCLLFYGMIFGIVFDSSSTFRQSPLLQAAFGLVLFAVLVRVAWEWNKRMTA
jgi:hypothetical protein